MAEKKKKKPNALEMLRERTRKARGGSMMGKRKERERKTKKK